MFSGSKRMASGRCRTICGMTQWRGIEAAGGDENGGLGAGNSALEPIVNTRSSPGTDTVRIQNILKCYNTLELMHPRGTEAAIGEASLVYECSTLLRFLIRPSIANGPEPLKTRAARHARYKRLHS